jgi:hypothetical protein
MNDAIEAAWPSQDCRIEDRRLIGSGDRNYTFAGRNAVEAVQELLQADFALRLARTWEGPVNILEQDHRWGMVDGLLKDTSQVCVVRT